MNSHEYVRDTSLLTGAGPLPQLTRASQNKLCWKKFKKYAKFILVLMDMEIRKKSRARSPQILTYYFQELSSSLQYNRYEVLMKKSVIT